MLLRDTGNLMSGYEKPDITVVSSKGQVAISQAIRKDAWNPDSEFEIQVNF